MTSVLYPDSGAYDANGNVVPGTNGLGGPYPTYNYAFDTMGRLNGMTSQSGSTMATVVNGVSYNQANQLTGMTYGGLQETRTYSSQMLQMTDVTVWNVSSWVMNQHYAFPTSGNNGKITSQTDNVSGETVSYTYDSLNRLATAGSSVWGDQYTYDGFGNLTTKTHTAGPAPSLSVWIDTATNRISGQTYDANGNQTPSGYIYDVENRLISTGTVQYAYDA